MSSLSSRTDPRQPGDLISVTFAILLAAVLVFLLAHLVPQLADLMMPPPLSGAR